MKRFLLLVLVSIFLSIPAKSQEQEIGIWGGGAHLIGDINNEISSLQYARYAGGLFYRNNFHSRWSWKTTLSYGRAEGADSTSTRLFQTTRNLSVRNDFYDLSSVFEFNFNKQKINQGFRQYFTPYLYMGVSLYYHNPQAMYQGDWIALQPLGTEGQQNPDRSGLDPYKRFQIGVPIGGGVKYYMTPNWVVGFDFSFRKTFTDYLDDVSTVYADPTSFADGIDPVLAVALADRSIESDGLPLGQTGRQRGSASRKDAFFFAGISLSYVFTDIKCPSPGGR